jgi:hypothetical protein
MPTADPDGMRKSTLGLLVLLSCGSCLEMEQTVSLAADGSGRQTVKVTLPEARLAELQNASQATRAGTASNIAAVYDKEAVTRELTGAGLTVVKHTTKRDGGRRTVEIEAAFADFAGLQKSPLCGSAAEWVLAPGPREGTAKLTLYPQGKAAWTEARARAEKLGTAADPVVADFFRKRRDALDGLDISVRFQRPGDVLVWTRNLDKTGDREVVAHITAQQIQTPEDLVRRLAPRFEVIFDATGCKLPLD